MAFLRGALRVDAQTDALARRLGRRAELCQLGRGVEHDVVGVIQKLVELVHPIGGAEDVVLLLGQLFLAQTALVESAGLSACEAGCEKRVEVKVGEYKLHEMWKSPNGTIRAVLDGTVFRAPIMIDSIQPVVKNWKKPITIARHAYGDVYKCTEFRIPGAGKAELVFTGADGSQQRATVFDFEGAGVLQGQYNKDDSIRSFARSCFNYALDVKQDLWFGAKDTISKKYDHTFKDIFQETYDAEYKEKFEAAGITYFYSLIDDIVARVIRSEGGFVWACKNYDGDVMSDMVSTAFGSLAMMTSVLVSPDGKYEYEAAHGTVTRHYYKYLKGEKTSTNPMATIFAWSGAFKKRGELDNLPELVHFGEALEAASLQTLNEGIMTKDLCGLAEGITPTAVDSEGFIKAIRERLEAKLA